MHTYEVKIFRDGKHVDTQVVKAETEGKAKSAAMAQTKVIFRGALASYVVVDTKANFVIRLAATGEPYTFATEAEAQAFADVNNAAHRRHGPR